jgi:dynamin 1-like protein
MENLISAINRIQEVISKSNVELNLELPQIVVVGAQSSGKSSIIECIVGKDFLPRGCGIVTRRPLILQLKQVKNGKEWAEFGHVNEKIDDFSRILFEIEKDTIRVAGNNKGISREPILLKIFSPNVVDLTLVDLPGLVKVPIGEQPQDIEEQVRNLIFEYISNPNAIILAISPANSDIANSDALRIAKEVDPHFQRTLGVLTKIDLMDPGTNVLDVLNNKIFPLKYGYIGVVCRSQLDTKNKKSIEEHLKTEREFFDNLKEYKNVRHLLGIRTLTNNLSELLIEQIKTTLPKLRDTISTAIYTKEQELENFGQESISAQKDIANSFILNLVSKFSHAYADMIEGKFVKDCSKFYIGGARINHIFQEIFKKEIDKIDPFDILSDDDIRTAIKNSNGLRPSLFIPELAFEVLVKHQITRLQPPSLMCVKRVFDELRNIVNQIRIPEINKYKKLDNKMRFVMEDVLNKCLEPTNQMIKNLIDIESSHINTSHPDFLGAEDSMLNLFEESTNVSHQNNLIRNFPLNFNTQNSNQNNSSSINSNANFQKKKLENEFIEEEESKTSKLERRFNYGGNQYQMRPGQASSRDVMETCIIKNLISSYFLVVKKSICDYVPKTIMCFLVNQSKVMAEKEMVSQLYNSSELETLLEEDPIIAKKRKYCKEVLTDLKTSLETLNEIKDIKMD